MYIQGLLRGRGGVNAGGNAHGAGLAGRRLRERGGLCSACVGTLACTLGVSRQILYSRRVYTSGACASVVGCGQHVCVCVCVCVCV